MRVEQRRLAKQQSLPWDQLGKLDRYKRRALSRCNKAIKAFDEACAAADSAAPRASDSVYVGLSPRAE